MVFPRPRSGAAALITGASSGIGEEAARQLAALGHNVVLVSRREERLLTLAGQLQQRHGVRAVVVACDLADAAARHALTIEVREHRLDIDILVNSAGYASGGPFARVSPDSHKELIRTNFEAMVELTGHFIGPMLVRRSGAVLNVSSFTGFAPMPGIATYSATKAAGRMFSEALHAEVESRGVTVTALCPGPVRTEFIEVAKLHGLVDNLPPFMWTSVEDCVRTGLNDLERGKRVSIPNRAVRLFTFAVSHLPHATTLAVLTRRRKARSGSRTENPSTGSAA
ncbi:MAG: SDR family oxidoreductase [Acidimicrobiaceae bacterium]|nr:SDR family oxidoreductase [Acidimicrobiaceae bacterium]